MPWTNPPIILYHGTALPDAENMQIPRPPLRHGVDLSLCRTLSDFGTGFYCTSDPHQAKEWAKQRCRTFHVANPQATILPAVLRFEVDRRELGALKSLIFTKEGNDL